MTEAQHTPGPWRLGAWPESTSKEQAAANAHLIATAPTMLAALEDCRKELAGLSMDMPPHHPARTAVVHADEAISKAKGNA